MTAYTYDGFMIRTPSENCNEHMLEIVRREASQDFGEWPVHIIQPMRRPGEIDYPRVRVTGFFTSFPIRGEMHLSSLVVAWFQDQPWPVPDAVSRPALEGIDWERLAVDYETQQPEPIEALQPTGAAISGCEVRWFSARPRRLNWRSVLF